jgi:hypothetical protein
LKRWRAILVCLTYLLALLVIFSTRSKMLDLALIAVLFGGRVILGTLAATQFRLHHDLDGQARFRYRPNSKIPMFWLYGFPTKWKRWLFPL